MSRALFLNQFGDLPGPNPKLQFTQEGMCAASFWGKYLFVVQMAETDNFYYQKKRENFIYATSVANFT